MEPFFWRIERVSECDNPVKLDVLVTYGLEESASLELCTFSSEPRSRVDAIVTEHVSEVNRCVYSRVEAYLISAIINISTVFVQLSSIQLPVYAVLSEIGILATVSRAPVRTVVFIHHAVVLLAVLTKMDYLIGVQSIVTHLHLVVLQLD